uniref:hypothetical protein n=1 Tax=Segatella hominis TaxID=2518605 RepID=UPI0040389409
YLYAKLGWCATTGQLLMLISIAKVHLYSETTKFFSSFFSNVFLLLQRRRFFEVYQIARKSTT